MNAGYYIASGLGGMIAGAIGAAVAESSDSHPILKGALVVGVTNVMLSAVLAAGYEAGQQQKQLGTSGALGGHPMFP